MATIERSLRHLRASLAAGVAFALIAQTVPVMAKVGVAAAVNTDARSRAPGAAQRVISIGENLVFNEQINTDGKGLVQILLLDGTTFTVGPNSQITIDEFVYNPESGEARVVASVTKGAFRFIGGQTSRKPGGATIKTPVGTIGIRGAMVEGNVQSSSSALFSMIFGNEVTFSGRGGARERIFKPGFTLTVNASAGGAGVDTDVRPRTKSDAATFQTALAGNTGSGSAGGGATERPTDGGVASSPVTAVVSNLPASVQVPENRPSPIQSSKIDTVEDNVAQIDQVASEQLTDAIVEGGATPAVPVPTPSPNRRGRVLTAPGTYVTFGESYPAAGGRGLVGSSPQSDRTAGFTAGQGRLISASTGLNLPDLTGTVGDQGLVRVNVSNAFGPNGPLSGPAYAGLGDFAAYFLGQNGDPTKPVYVIVGTGTDEARLRAAESGTDIREYTLTQDPIRPSPVPFFATDIYGAVNNANGTNFLVVEPNNSSSGEIETFLTWIDISGSGAGQKSATMVYASSDVPTDDGHIAFDGSRRGSFRPGALDGIYNMRGDIASIGGPDGSHLFGPNANHFVLGASVDPADAYFDVSSRGAFTGNPADGYTGDGTFSTHHVSNLVSETPQAAVGRTTRVAVGFMTGMAESSVNAPGETYSLLSTDVPNFVLALNANENSVYAQGVLTDPKNHDDVVDELLLTFGASDTAPGGNTFVDDNRYGAVHNTDPENTRLRTDGGQDVAHYDGLRPGSYIVSGRAAPIAGYQHCPTCSFVDWGWWGTRATFSGNGTAELPETRSEFVHLGTWVAGDISNPADLPTTIVASYSGTALGSVSRQTGTGVANYVASGGFGMTYDFNARRGDMTITDFDGFNLSGSVTDAQIPGQSLIFSAISGGAAVGTVVGAFVDNGLDVAAGVIGDFEFSTVDVRAVGTLVGGRVGAAPVTGQLARILFQPEAFDSAFDDGDPYPRAGERGLVGSMPDADRTAFLSRYSGRLVNGLRGVDLPDLSALGETGLAAVSVTDAFGENRPASGTAYAGRGDFTAYLLGFDGDRTQPFYTLVGTGATAPQLETLFTGTNIREYSLTQDPVRPSPVPFFANDLYGTPLNSNSTNLIIVESDTRSLHTPGEPIYDTKVYQSWVDISGTGVNQKSAVFATLPSIVDDGDATDGFEGGRRGSFRYAATAGPANIRGGLGTMGNGENDHFFGPDVNNFVVGNPTNPADAFSDSLLGPGYSGTASDGYLGDGVFGTQHVADLVSKTPGAGLSRTQRNVAGFMTGMGESNVEGIDNPYVLGSGGAANFTMSLDPRFNSVTARATVRDVNDQNSVVDNYLLSFGFLPGGQGGANAFVDDDRFAAHRNGDNQATRLRTDGGQDIANRTGDNPGSYLVSGRANPIAGFQHCTSCRFLDWGWWGTRVRIDANGAEIPDGRSDFVHMGTWVAGDITNPANLPNNISASYAGTALGTVARETAGGVAKYIAAGDMNMNYDFATRTGNMQISNFDGMSASGLISEVANPTQALFAGGLGGPGGVTGRVSGAFVNNGLNGPGDVPPGVIGEFGLSGSGVSAVGTIAGAVVP